MAQPTPPDVHAWQIYSALQSLSEGNFAPRMREDLPPPYGQIARTLNAHFDMLENLDRELRRVVSEVGITGRLGPTAEVPAAAGSWRLLVDVVNRAAANLTNQIRHTDAVVGALLGGDYSKRILAESVQGELYELRQRVNALAEKLEAENATAV